VDDETQSELVHERTSLASRGCGVIGCLLLIGVLVAVVAGAYLAGNALEPLADRFLWSPADVVDVYLAAYDEGNTERARSFLCASAAKDSALDPGASFETSSSSAFVDDRFPYPRDNGRLAIYYAVRVPGFSTPRRAQALLEREEGGWRICQFTK
jgi:hypothetical protein